MKAAATAAWVLLLLLALQPALASPNSPYSDAAFRTFISLSANNTTITAKITFLNITYFRQVDQEAIEEIGNQVAASQDPNDLLSQRGTYSTENFTAEILPLNGSALRFTFEGMEVSDGGGANCSPVFSDGNGIARCNIQTYRDANGQVHPIADYKSCGYVTVVSDEMMRGAGKYPSATQTVTFCPSTNAALSALAPAIFGAVNSRFGFCFPAMLIAGLLMAAMYYSGRDPLSLFDITTPKLPKTRTFKVRMGQSPQMLRQVTRRYIMLKRQARRSALLTIDKMARTGGMGREKAAEAKRAINAFYNKVDAMLKKGPLSKTDENALTNELKGIMSRYQPTGLGNELTAKQKKEVEDFVFRIQMTGDLLMTYLQSHAAMMAMKAARSKGTGNIISRKVVTPVVDKLTNASIAFDTSKAGKILGIIEKWIPFVPKVISTPSKVLDVMAQFRGSRAALKGIRNEMVGQAAYMLGHKKDGSARAIYRIFERLNVRKDSDGKTVRTKFGSFHNWLTGRNWENFEKKHDLGNKSLVSLDDRLKQSAQDVNDLHNAMFDSISKNLLSALPIRASAVKELAEELKGMSKEEMERLMRAKSFGRIFDAIKPSLKKDAEGEKIAKEIGKMLKELEDAGSLKPERMKEIISALEKMGGRIGGLGSLTNDEKSNAKEFAGQLCKSLLIEQQLVGMLKGPNERQADILDKMHELAHKNGKNKELLDAIKQAIGTFREAEEKLRNEMPLAYLGKDNYYRMIDREALLKEIGMGKDEKWLVDKYGKGIMSLVSAQDCSKYAGMLDVRTADTGKKLKDAIAALKASMGGELSAADAAALDSLAAAYGAKGKLTTKEAMKVLERMEKMESLKGIERSLLANINAKEADIKNWLIGNGENELTKKYERIAEGFNDRLTGADVEKLAREGCTYGKNPLEPAIIAAFRKMGNRDEYLFKTDMDGKRVPIFTSMDTLDQYFGKAGSKDPNSKEHQFREMLRQQNKDPEVVFNSLMKTLLRYQVDWVGRSFAASEIMHNGINSWRYMANFGAAAKDVNDSGTFKSNKNYLRGEKPMTRQEMGMAAYKDLLVESQLFHMRLWEKISGYVVSHKWEGTSRGEQALGGYAAAKENRIAVLEIYKKFYQNLVNPESDFYDKEFAKKMGIGPENTSLAIFDAKAYNAILERGYRWQDKKNGMELLMNVDGRSMPMLEYDPKYLPEKMKDGIVRKGDIVDYSALTARVLGSTYSSREIGFVILKRVDEKDDQGNVVRTKWIYADPFNDKDVHAGYAAADRQISFRREIIEGLAGIRDGNYNQKNAPIKVLSTKDFITFSRKNREEIGDYNSVDRAREWIREKAYNAAMKSAEFNYGAYADRLEKMSAWYAAQFQVRQSLDRMSRTIDANMMGGSERFRMNEKVTSEIYERMAARGVMDEETREKVEAEMKRIEKGKDGSFAEGAKAWWYAWRGSIASVIMKNIGDEENRYFNTRLEIRALDKLHEKGEIGKSEYDAIRKELAEYKKDIKRDYDEARKEYGDFNRMLIDWVGSQGRNTYNPNKTMWHRGIAGMLLDSRWVQGSNDAFYQITESSVMRDPRVAIGAGPGLDYSWYVGYHTGQNVYERARFWATNSLWERGMHFQLNLAYGVHKWWNDKISFMSRYTSGYPAPVKSDMMYAPTYEHRNAWDYVKAVPIIIFKGSTYSDFFKARLQDTITFTGMGHMIAAYQSTGGYERGDPERSWARKMLDRMGADSPHNFGTPFQIAGLHRYVDQVNAFDKYIDSQGIRIKANLNGEELDIGEVRRRLDKAIEDMNTDEMKNCRQAMFEAIGDAVTLKDRRGKHIRNVFSGRDIAEDGSRNRFLDMYIMFHSNVFAPTIPGMLQASPIKGDNEWHSFPQVAKAVEGSADKTWLGMSRNYWEASYDRGADGKYEINFNDRFTTRLDSVAEAYKNDMPILMHLMKMQNKEINYSALNTPSIAFINPLLVPAGRFLYRTMAHAAGSYGIPSSLSSLSSTVQETWASRRMTHQPKPPKYRSEKTEYPSGLYKEPWLLEKAERLVDNGSKTSEYLKETAGWRWVAKRWKQGRAASGVGAKKLSDDAMADRIEMLLATGLYDDDFE